MEHSNAIILQKVMEDYSTMSDSSVIDTLPPKLPLSNFHQWADDRRFEGGFLLENSLAIKVWLLIVEWNPKNGFYLVLFPENKSGPVAEIHQVFNEGDGELLKWKYSPKKGDGQNPKRKDYFEQYFKSLDVLIAIPSAASEVQDFVDELISLFDNRLKADRLDENTPNYRDGFPEGKLKERLHKYRERNTALTKLVKQEAFSKHGKLECECCEFDFAKTYGVLGNEYIEAHHIIPVSDLHPNGDKTKKEEIALVCANCHRMLHKTRPWLTIEELRSIRDKN